LREYFDDQLIVPVGRRMVLTPLAEGLVQKVNDVLLMVDATLGTKPEFDPATSRRHFSIVASDYVASVLLLDVLQAVHHEAPGLTIELRQPSTLAYQELEAGEVDFVINPESYSVATQSSCMLFEDSYHAVVDRHNTAVGDSISMAQYKQLRHVIFQANGRPFYDAWFDRSHGEGRSIEVLANSFTLLPRLVVGTQRIATLHTRLAMQACEHLPVRMVRLGFDTPRFVETLQWHGYRDHDLGSLWLRERILQFAQALPALPVTAG
jgi:LysR family transcriptional regulator, nod-box dependent transcriptional activator